MINLHGGTVTILTPSINRARFPVFVPVNPHDRKHPRYVRGDEDEEAIITATASLFVEGDRSRVVVELRKMLRHDLLDFVQKMRASVNLAVLVTNIKPVYHYEQIFTGLHMFRFWHTCRAGVLDRGRIYSDYLYNGR